jgi:hypothetical protein
VFSVDDPGQEVPKLEGPPHDVEAITATLIETGFSKSDVIVLQNPDRRRIEKEIDDIAQAFSQQSYGEASRRSAAFRPIPIIRVALRPMNENISAPNNTLFLFFFSGHGVNVGGTEYIIPKLPLGPTREEIRPKDIENSAISVKWLKETLERSAAASVIILDTHFPAIFETPAN